MTGEIEFRLASEQPDLFGLWGAHEELVLESGQVRVELRDSEGDQDHSSVARSLIATVTREIEAVDEAALTGWHERLETELVETKEDDERHGGFVVNPRTTTIRWEQGQIEPNLKQLFSFARHDLRAEIERIAAWITWRFNLIPDEAHFKGGQADGSGPRPAALEYRLIGDRWRVAPGDFGWQTSRNLGGATPEEIADSERDAVQSEMSNQNQQAPLAWAMFQRSLRSASSDPRVSLVFAVAAAEIAIKQCIVALDSSPVASWILIDEQSPPWSKLVKEPLGLVTPRRIEGSNRVLPKSITAPIESALQRRNQFIHRGDTAFEEDELETLLLAVNDLLYALEWLKGSDWALDRISTQSRREWGNP